MSSMNKSSVYQWYVFPIASTSFDLRQCRPKKRRWIRLLGRHWSAEMKAVAGRLHTERHNHRRTIVLLFGVKVSRHHPLFYRPSKNGFSWISPSFRYSDARETLAAESQTEDIVRLPDCLTENLDSILHTPAVIVIIKYLSKVCDKKHRSRALQIGHKTSKRDALGACSWCTAIPLWPPS